MLGVDCISLDITDKCSGPCGKGRCSYCVRHGDNVASGRQQLTPDEIKLFLNTIDSWYESYVFISGGEPSEREDLDEVLKAVQPRSTRILTNGYNMDRLLSLKNTATLYEFDYTIHSDAYDRSHVDKIRALVRAYPRKRVHVSAVLTKENISNSAGMWLYKNMLNFPSCTKGQRYGLRFLPVVPFKHVPKELVLGKDDKNAISSDIQQYVACGEPINNFLSYLFGGNRNDCINQVPIRYDGEVMLCFSSRPVSFGNVRDDAEGAIRCRAYFMQSLNDMRKEIIPLVKQDEGGFRIYCALHLEKLFDEHPEIWQPIYEKAMRR